MNARDKREMNERIKILEKVGVFLSKEMLDLEEYIKLERELNPDLFLARYFEATNISANLKITRERINTLSSNLNIHKNLSKDEVKDKIIMYEKAAI